MSLDFSRTGGGGLEPHVFVRNSLKAVRHGFFESKTVSGACQLAAVFFLYSRQGQKDGCYLKIVHQSSVLLLVHRFSDVPEAYNIILRIGIFTGLQAFPVMYCFIFRFKCIILETKGRRRLCF